LFLRNKALLFTSISVTAAHDLSDTILYNYLKISSSLCIFTLLMFVYYIMIINFIYGKNVFAEIFIKI